MPARKKTRHKTHNPIKRLKRSHKGLHKLFVLAAIVVIWRGIWTAMDYIFEGNDPLLIAVISASVALLFLFIDDFKFKELER